MNQIFTFSVSRVSFAGEEAAENMRRYSEIGTKYVKIIKNVIKENNLHLFETEV